MPMLSLRRKCGESVVIDANGTIIKVFVSKNTRGKLQLIFDAPAEVKILRTEIIQNMKKGETTIPESV